MKRVGVLAVLILLLPALGQAGPGAWKQVGKSGAWKATIAGTALADAIYTVESSGALYRTDPASGRWKALGKPAFKNTRFMFSAGGKLYTIERNGNLYAVEVR